MTTRQPLPTDDPDRKRFNDTGEAVRSSQFAFKLRTRCDPVPQIPAPTPRTTFLAVAAATLQRGPLLVAFEQRSPSPHRMGRDGVRGSSWPPRVIVKPALKHYTTVSWAFPVPSPILETVLESTVNPRLDSSVPLGRTRLSGTADCLKKPSSSRNAARNSRTRCR